MKNTEPLCRCGHEQNLHRGRCAIALCECKEFSISVPTESPTIDWEAVHALLEPWEKVWNGDKAKFTAKYPQWIVDAAAEVFAHDICDHWSYNDYVPAVTVIIARHLAASRTLTTTASLPVGESTPKIK